MPRHPGAALVSSLFPLLLVPGTVSAQGEPEMIRRDVAETLISGGPFSGGPVEILVGEMPGSTARVVPLTEAETVVGSLSYPTRTEVLITDPDSATAVGEAFEGRLLEAGWERYMPPPMGLGGGFTSNRRGGGANQYCMGDTASLAFSVQPGPDGGSRIRVTHPRPGTGYQFCREQGRERRPVMESPLPALAPPTGVEMRGSGSSGGGDRFESSARAESDMPVPELTDHFHRQLVAAGWEPVDEASAGTAAVRSYRFVDGYDEEWVGALAVYAPDGESVRLLILEATRLGGW